ncbi:MAG: ketoacyl-ACP synthase III [Selenomonadaceae bacterium]|nr:ketoacyl-ACP synthase III [Selenomonadaceae bacterium]
MDRLFDNVRIDSIATALPAGKLDFLSLAPSYGEEYVRKVMAVTGIQGVHVTTEHETTADLCVVATEQLLAAGRYTPEDIDALVFVTETPDYRIPNTSSVLQARLGLRNDILVFDLNFGCAGYVYGLFQASLLIASGYAQRVLLCAGDTLTKTIHPQDRALRLVLGDAGSATLLTRDTSAAPSGFAFYTDGSRADKLMIPAGGCRTPRVSGVTDVPHEDEDGNVRTAENMYMDGMEVMTFALHEVKGVVQRVYDLCNITGENIDLFALHQANAMIVNYVARKLKAKGRAPIAIEHTGNTSCTSIPLLLSQRYVGQNEALKRVLACGFGTGLTCAAGLIDLSSTQIFAPVTLA